MTSNQDIASDVAGGGGGGAVISVTVSVPSNKVRVVIVLFSLGYFLLK